MVIDIAAIEEDLGKFKTFQWVKSENAGRICRFRDLHVDNDVVYVNLVDSQTGEPSRINYELMGEFIRCLTDEIDHIGAEEPRPAQVQKVSLSAPAPQKSPVKALLDKQKSNPTEITLTLTLNVPSPALFKVICESFDNAELEVLEHIVEGINIESVRDAVKQTLAEYYTKE
jgi:hypothetical protein